MQKQKKRKSKQTKEFLSLVPYVDQPPTTLNPWQLRIDLDRIYLKILVQASCLRTTFLLLSFAFFYSFGKFIFLFVSFCEGRKEFKSK